MFYKVVLVGVLFLFCIGGVCAVDVDIYGEPILSENIPDNTECSEVNVSTVDNTANYTCISWTDDYIKDLHSTPSGLNEWVERYHNAKPDSEDKMLGRTYYINYLKSVNNGTVGDYCLNPDHLDYYTRKGYTEPPAKVIPAICGIAPTVIVSTCTEEGFGIIKLFVNLKEYITNNYKYSNSLEARDSLNYEIEKISNSPQSTQPFESSHEFSVGEFKSYYLNKNKDAADGEVKSCENNKEELKEQLYGGIECVLSSTMANILWVVVVCCVTHLVYDCPEGAVPAVFTMIDENYDCGY